MDHRFTPQTSQKADVRPICFMLDDMGSLGDPLLLPIRPTDLTRSETAHAMVHHTLGRDVSGWVDDFGRGLPTINISGNTGWRTNPWLGRDGFQSFEALHDLVVVQYAGLRQDAVDQGRDPSQVKLLFVDMLDNFCYPVHPMNFVLRRSKSQPLLFQYTMTLQALSLSIDGQPNFGGGDLAQSGVSSLGGVAKSLTDIGSAGGGAVSGALSSVGIDGTAVGGLVSSYAGMLGNVLSKVQSSLSGAGTKLIDASTSQLISSASDLSKAGANAVHAVAMMASGAPNDEAVQINKISSAFNLSVAATAEAKSRGVEVYSDYSTLFSDAPGQATLQSQNAFMLMQPKAPVVSISEGSYASLDTLKRSDPVLATPALPELERLLGSVLDGVKL